MITPAAQTLVPHTFTVSLLQHRNLDQAAAIHNVWVPAYTQEAALLGVQHLPPLLQSVADLQASADLFYGAWHNAELLGVISLGPDEDPQQLCINCLVVHPAHQRQGIARLLLQTLLHQAPAAVFVVNTAAANTPAMALYQRFGFEVVRRGLVRLGVKAGKDADQAEKGTAGTSLALVKLRRPGQTPHKHISPTG
jgi:ribosomal protein S18 acetylase RimI-like enzyme